ncbi:hypothetical protein F1559_000109 [Cyanidiococcus yangmingshanensis]|uniref:Anaphase-promoting complex subunit 4 n=1 Tax=Cyanidiococcus yangmingshanensis TaxID=2690220 RepID=A0A7J7IJ96_9RHOD|nr:hypothetical protein F1559_000109 [Cyanidiococcus yangmingshanensis]
MQVIGGSSFICLQDRALSLGTISQAAWSSTQDLLALVFAPASIVILRLSWQLVGAWSPPNEDPENEVASITALCWSPHGPSIVVGQADGTLTTLSVENMHAMTIHQPADDPGDTDYGGWTRLIWHPLPNRYDASLLVGVRERSSDVFFFMSGIYACGTLGIPLMEPLVDISITEDARYLAVLGSNEAVLISALSPVLPLLPHWEMLAHWDVYTRERTQQLQCAMKTLQEHWQTTAQAMSQILDTLTDTLLLYRPDANKEVAFRELLLLVYGMTPSPAVRDWLASTMSDANQRTSSRSVVTSLNASVDLASSHLIPLLNALLAHVGQLPDTPKAALETAKACWLAGQRLALALKRLRPLYIALWNWLAGQSDENLQLLVDREKVVSLFREDEFGLPDMDKKMKFSRGRLPHLKLRFRKCERAIERNVGN